MLFDLESVVMIGLFAHSLQAYYIKFPKMTLSLHFAMLQFSVSFIFCGYLFKMLYVSGKFVFTGNWVRISNDFQASSLLTSTSLPLNQGPKVIVNLLQLSLYVHIAFLLGSTLSLYVHLLWQSPLEHPEEYLESPVLYFHCLNDPLGYAYSSPFLLFPGNHRYFFLSSLFLNFPECHEVCSALDWLLHFEICI